MTWVRVVFRETHGDEKRGGISMMRRTATARVVVRETHEPNTFLYSALGMRWGDFGS